MNVVTDGNKEDAPISRVSGKVTDDKTKCTLSSNSLYSLLGEIYDERSAFHKDFKIRGFIGKNGQKDKLIIHKLAKAKRRRILRDKEIKDTQIKK